MQMILVLIGLSFVTILLGKVNWKSDVVKYVLVAVVALAQTIYILYKMLSMQFPFN